MCSVLNTYFIKAFIIGLDSHASQDVLDILGGGAGVSTQHSQKVSGHVTHSEKKKQDFLPLFSPA